LAVAARPSANSIGSSGALGNRCLEVSSKSRAMSQSGKQGKSMARLLLILGFLCLAVGLLWIGQGTGVIAWPQSSFMINQLQWAGYGAVLGAVGLILIWQGKA
jgi:hypothetical protein